MTDDVQGRLDEFARRLGALNVEFEELKREVRAEEARPSVVETRPAPVAAPARDVPDWLRRVDELFAAGEDRLALHEADRLRAQAAAEPSAERLTELLAYLARVETSRGTELARLVLLVDRSLRFIRSPRPVQPFPTAARPAQPAPAAPAVAMPKLPPRPQLPQWNPPRITASDLLGPRALAIAGGIVTLLGILFFFVLAVNRGWIGPTGRVALGAAAAALVFTAGHVLRRRYGTTHAALAAVGTGIAGGYATLLSAAALYDLLPHWGALLGAAGIAALGLTTALLWRSQVVAGLGLVGAILVPLALITQGSLSPLGTAFAGVVLVAAAVVGIRLDWLPLLGISGLATAGQLVRLFAETRYRFEAPASVLACSAFVSLVFLAIGVAKQLRSKAETLDTVASWFSTTGAALAVAAASVLFATPEQRGFAFLAIAGVYAAAGAFFLLRAKTRDLSALLTFVAFALGAVAVAELLTGKPLAYAWAAEAAGLAWLARRVREPRFEAWAIVYALLALGHLLFVDAQPRDLLTAVMDSAAGAPAALAVAAAAAVCAWYARPWQEEIAGDGVLAELTRRWATLHSSVRRITAWGAAALAVYAASLGTLALFSQYDWGWVAVSGLWTGVGVVFLAVALRRPALGIERGSLVWIGVSAVVAVARSLPLASEPRAWTLVVVAGVLLAGALLSLASLDVSALLATAATAIGAFGTAALLPADWRAYAWAAQAVLFAALAWRFAAPHFRLLAIGVLVLAADVTLALVAVPQQLLEPNTHPAHGALTAVAVALAAALVAAIPAGDAREYTTLAAAAESFRRANAGFRVALIAAAGVFATYAASLGVLALFSSFAWGTVAVAGLWTSLGLVVFGAGALRGSVALRAGGLVWLLLSGALAVEQAARLLGPTPRAWSFGIVGVAGLVLSIAYSLAPWRSRLEPPRVTAVLGMAAALALFTYPIGSVLTGRTQGAALLGVGALWALLAAVLFARRARDLSTLYWAVAVGLVATADAELLAGTYAVLGWAVVGVAVAWLAHRVREPRLYGGAGVLLALAIGRAVILEAPPTHLFVERYHPFSGALSLFVGALALAAAARLAHEELKRLGNLRALPWWLAGGLAVYGLSLVILELVERISGAASTWHSSAGRPA